MFTTHYQPIVELSSGQVAGFEALTRTIADDGSVEAAGPLIEKIEQDAEAVNGLIESVLKCIKRDVADLFERYPQFYVSVNIPPVALGTGKLVRMLHDLGLRPHLSRLVCELTERQVLTETGRSALALARKEGLRVALDDFGTGHSGLAQIVGLDLDILKIDRSLIPNPLSNRMASRLLRGVLALASVMRVHTVAEGVESAEQAFFLDAAGVDYGQGWLWSKALPATELENALRNGFPRPVAGRA